MAIGNLGSLFPIHMSAKNRKIGLALSIWGYFPLSFFLGWFWGTELGLEQFVFETHLCSGRRLTPFLAPGNFPPGF